LGVNQVVLLVSLVDGSVEIPPGELTFTPVDIVAGTPPISLKSPSTCHFSSPNGCVVTLGLYRRGIFSGRS